jgi:hypothetical protein
MLSVCLTSITLQGLPVLDGFLKHLTLKFTRRLFRSLADVHAFGTNSLLSVLKKTFANS